MSHRRILHVDDDELLLRSVRRLLKAEGFVVHSVTTPEAAEQTLAETSFDAVIVDLDLRDKDGMDLIGSIRVNYPLMHVFVLSGAVTTERRERAEELEVAQVFSKPADIAQFSEAIRLHTGASRTTLRRSEDDDAPRSSELPDEILG